MFIRRTKTRTTESGEHYYSYRLVDSHRIANRVRQRTLLNLGNTFTLPHEHWPLLTQRIEHIILGQLSTLIPYPFVVEREAQHISALLLNKYSSSELFLKPGKAQEKTVNRPASIDNNSQEAQEDEDNRDIHTVDLNSLALMNSRSVGTEAVALSALSTIKRDEKLASLGFNDKQINAALGNIIGRMVQPGSELSTHQWLQQNSALGELLDCDYSQQSLSALYRASDLLWKYHEDIEATVYQQHCLMFDTESTITLFDLTNTFFEGTGQYNSLAAYGHSKEKRSDCPLVTLARVLDGNGFSRRSRIYPGNVSESGTLQQMLEGLMAPNTPPSEASGACEEKTQEPEQQSLIEPCQRPTIVMDAGIATEENITWLKQQDYPYIVVSRKQHLEFDEDKAVAVNQDQGGTVRAMRIERKDGEIELYCHSEQREAKERAINERFISRFEQELDYLAEGLDKPRRLKNAKKVSEKIGRLRQKYARAAKNYTVSIQNDEKGKNTLALTYQRIESEQESDAYSGVYCLRSSHKDWNESRLWQTYTLLTDLEAVFRSLKSEIGMRPIYHQKTERVEGHLFITVLAYNLVHQIRLGLKAQNIHDSWETIRTTLSTQMRTTLSLRDKEGKVIHLRKSSYPNAEQQVLLRALELTWNPGKTQKTIIVP
jgi:transposase